MCHPCKSQHLYCLTHTPHCQTHEISPGKRFAIPLEDEMFPRRYPLLQEFGQSVHWSRHLETLTHEYGGVLPRQGVEHGEGHIMETPPPVDGLIHPCASVPGHRFKERDSEGLWSGRRLLLGGKGTAGHCERLQKRLASVGDVGNCRFRCRGEGWWVALQPSGDSLLTPVRAS